MIPTPHFRWFKLDEDSVPVLQQLWLSMKADEREDWERVLSWEPEDLMQWREHSWEEIPMVIQNG